MAIRWVEVLSWPPVAVVVVLVAGLLVATESLPFITPQESLMTPSSTPISLVLLLSIVALVVLVRRATNPQQAAAGSSPQTAPQEPPRVNILFVPGSGSLVLPKLFAEGSRLPVHVVVDGLDGEASAKPGQGGLGGSREGASLVAEVRKRLGPFGREAVVHSLQHGRPARKVIGDLNIGTLVVAPWLGGGDGSAAAAGAAALPSLAATTATVTSATAATSAAAAYLSGVHDVISGALPQKPARIIFLAGTPPPAHGARHLSAVVAGALLRSYAASLRAEMANLGTSISVVSLGIREDGGEDEAETREAMRIVLSLADGEPKGGGDWHTKSASWTLRVLRWLPEWAARYSV